eukprot:3440853-Amphidinium_carterae.1
MGPPDTSVPQRLHACKVFAPTSPAIARPTKYLQAAFASPPPRLWWGPPAAGGRPLGRKRLIFDVT